MAIAVDETIVYCHVSMSRTPIATAASLLALTMAACGSGAGPSGSPPGDGGPLQQKTVEIIAAGSGFQLLRDGAAYPIHGAGGATSAGPASLAALAAAGGNSTRTWGPDENILGAAAAQGITVTLGFSDLTPATVLDYVTRHRGDPALLLWALGNELESGRSGDEQVALWKQINALALQVKAADPDHPVITVVAEIGGNKLQLLDQYAPALDAVGINSYGGVTSLAARVAQSGFSRPWLVTEFGPVGWWETAQTSWGAPIEDSSTAKAAHYLQGWQQAVQGQPTCLGGYAFLWGDKVEKTHTWFGMFLPSALGGDELEAVDAMTYAWTGSWPSKRAPQINGGIQGGLKLVPHGGSGDGTQRTFTAGSQIDATVDATDPGGAPLTYSWELRADGASIATAGGVGATSGPTAVLKLPAAAGTYRAFVYVRGASGHGATATAVMQAQ
jgi:hypothetical protein